MSNFNFKLRLNRIFTPHTKNTIEKLRLNPKLRKSGHLSNHGHPGPPQGVPRICSDNLKTPRNQLISTPRTLGPLSEHAASRAQLSVQTTHNPSGQPFDSSVETYQNPTGQPFDLTVQTYQDPTGHPYNLSVKTYSDPTGQPYITYQSKLIQTPQGNHLSKPRLSGQPSIRT